MEELKTLKDLRHEQYTTQTGYPDFAFIYELRQEAIKWLSKVYGKEEYYNSGNSRDGFIMEFFNLTEEDLK